MSEKIDQWLIKIKYENNDITAEKGRNFEKLPKNLKSKISEIINNINNAVKKNESLLTSLKKKLYLDTSEFHKKTEFFIKEQIAIVDNVFKNFIWKTEEEMISRLKEYWPRSDLLNVLKSIIENNDNIFSQVADTNKNWNSWDAQKPEPLPTNNVPVDGSNEALMWPGYNSNYFNTP